MNIRRFGMSFKDAWKGLRFVFMHEQNFRIHCTIGVVVISTTIFLPLATADRAIIFLTIAMVLGFELINTAIEKLLDVVNPRLHEQVKLLKDIMAGLVLVSAGVAAIIGSTIFIPALIEYIQPAMLY